MASGLRQAPVLESIWDYPSIPQVSRAASRIQVIFNGFLVADSSRPLRLVRCGHAPQFYLPAEDVRMEYLVRSGYHDELVPVGATSFYTLIVGDRSEPNAAWTFQHPAPHFAELAEHIAFSSSKIDAAFVDGEPVHAPARESDGGWVTRGVIGTSEGYPKGWRLERPSG